MHRTGREIIQGAHCYNPRGASLYQRAPGNQCLPTAGLRSGIENRRRAFGIHGQLAAVSVIP
jgi:hypothetical protein